MTPPEHAALSRRERQIMDVIYARGRASASEILEHMADPPSNSTIRTLLRLLEDKGHLVHTQEGPRYIYAPRVPRRRASHSALKHMIDTFFDGAPENVVTALLEMKQSKLSPEALRAMRQAIARAEREGR